MNAEDGACVYCPGNRDNVHITKKRHTRLATHPPIYYYAGDYGRSLKGRVCTNAVLSFPHPPAGGSVTRG